MMKLAALSAIAVSAAATVAFAQYTTPNVQTGLAPTSATLGQYQFTNLGLVGAGRIDAAARDDRNETLGSISSMTIDPATWTLNNGVYSGRLLTLPDRGYNDPGNGVFSDYIGRIQGFDMTFTPYTGAALPQAKVSQNQIGLAYTGITTTLVDERGNATTGVDPTGVRTAFGQPLPDAQVIVNGSPVSKTSLDAEGLALKADGSYYVSDEYASGIYHYSSGGDLIAVIKTPEALVPRSNGQIDFNSVSPPTDSGRRNNQGMEGLSLTPDGRYLIAVNQSAAVQDLTAGTGQSNRRLTRALVFDVSTDPAPAEPIGHYVLDLPTYKLNGNGGAVDRTAAQSEVLALSADQFLVLSRDGNGLGTGTSNPQVFKSLLLADVSGATNLVGTPYEGVTSVVDGDTLRSDITPVSFVEVLNMLNPDQLAQIGMNLNVVGSGDLTTALSEKQEGLALVPALDPANPNDYFLFIGNDNDFLTTNGSMRNADGMDQPYDAGLNNDSVLLAYRVRLEVVPEPTTLGLLALPGLLLRRRH